MKTSSNAFHEPAPLGFLASEYAGQPPETAAFHFWPVPLECSVSYGSGTRRGPEQLLAASQQLEKWDGHGCPGDAGLFTGQPCRVDAPIERVLADIEQRVEWSWSLDATPLLFGGEHTVSVGAFRALAKRAVPVGVVQFDAHADLRAEYQNSPWSHACVMRRAHELGLPISQWGVRALSPEEVDYRRVHAIHHVDADVLAAGPLPALQLPPDFPPEVYVTLDVDVLDPAVMPATGTPEPGGLGWYGALDLLARLSAGRRIVGADVVELAPIPGLHHPQFTAARLVYELMGLAR